MSEVSFSRSGLHSLTAAARERGATHLPQWFPWKGRARGFIMTVVQVPPELVVIEPTRVPPGASITRISAADGSVPTLTYGHSRLRVDTQALLPAIIHDAQAQALMSDGTGGPAERMKYDHIVEMVSSLTVRASSG